MLYNERRLPEDLLLDLERLSEGPMVLGLDFDGTLVPFETRPDEVQVDAATRLLLSEVAERPGTVVAVMSGRPLTDISERVGLSGLAYVGCHGADVLLPDGTHGHLAGPRCRATAQIVRQLLLPLVVDLPGVWVEDKGPVVAVHFRRAGPSARMRFRERLAAWPPTKLEGMVRARAGAEVHEFFPVPFPTKGDALAWIARRSGVRPFHRVVLIGDDACDEESFTALGPDAVTVRVGRAWQNSAARHHLEGPHEVRLLLEWVAARTPAGVTAGP